MAKPPLTVHDAAIRTATVEIKTLTVSGKQVTLAVFRQLREQPLVREDGTLAGQPWGIVNYHPDKCAQAEEHWHIVWQHGDELRRSAVTVTPPFEEFWPYEGDRFITSCVHDLATTGSTRYFQGNPPLRSLVLVGTEGTQIPTGHDGFSVRAALSDHALMVASALLEIQRFTATLADSQDEQGRRWTEHQLDRARERLAEKLPAFTAEVAAFEATTDELYERYKAVIDEEKARRDRHVAIRRSLATLPQLFIAV